MDIQMTNIDGATAENYAQVTSSPHQLHHRRSDKRFLENKDGTTQDTNSSPPPTMEINASETVSRERNSSSKRDGSKEENGITKGVMLNATQILHPKDIKWISDKQINSKTKDHELVQNHMISASSEIFSVTKTADVPPDLTMEKMSVCRKFLFGISFFPSFFFVLCITIIIPCKKTDTKMFCVSKIWDTTLNDSDFSTDFALPSNLIVGLSSDESGSISSFDPKTGDELWNFPLRSPPSNINCRDFDANADGIYDCLLLDKTGIVYAYNISDGYRFWNLSVDEFSTSFPPVILSDCDNDGVREIAVASSKSKIHIIAKGEEIYEVIVQNCKSVPINMRAWSRLGKVDLIFYCEKENGSGSIWSLEEGSYCRKSKINGSVLSVEAEELFKSGEIDLSQSQLLSTDNGLIVWSEHRVVLTSNGSIIWQRTTSDPSDSRFLLYGFFHKNQKEVALIRGDSSNGTVVTLFNALNGKKTASWSDPKFQAKKVFSVSDGRTKDYLMVILQKGKDDETSSFTTSGATSAVSNNSEAPKDDVEWRLSLLQSKDGSTSTMEEHVISTGSYKENGSFFSAVALVNGEDQTKTLTVFLGRALSSLASNSTTKYRSRLEAMKAEHLDRPEELSSCA